MPDPTGRISHIHDMHRGFSWKPAVRVATTANITISTALNNADSLDGVTLATGDRVLVKNQSTGSQNGIYIVGTSPGRAADMDQDGTTSVPAEEVMGSVVYVIAGTANAGTLWRNTNLTAPTLGTTSLTFAAVSLSSIAASAVTLADAGGYYTATDVEAALQELAKKDIGYTAHGNTGATETFDALIGWHSATLDANSTFTFTGATSGLVASMVLELLQDGTGSRLVTWPGSVVWAAGSAPTLSTTPAATDVLLFESRDGGTNWFGFPTGAAGSALTIKDEGSSLATAATSIDFVGAGVTASGTGAAKTVTITGSAVADILDLTTAETDASLVLAPDGAGGVEFRAETGGGGFTSSYVGYDTVGGSSEALVATRQYMKKITLAATQLIVGLSIHVDVPSVTDITRIQPGVWADTSGAPTLLLANGADGGVTSFVVAAAARWLHFPLGPILLTAGDYWIGFTCLSQGSSASMFIYYDGSGSDQTIQVGAYLLDGNYAGNTNSTKTYSIRATALA